MIPGLFIYQTLYMKFYESTFWMKQLEDTCWNVWQLELMDDFKFRIYLAKVRIDKSYSTDFW